MEVNTGHIRLKLAQEERKHAHRRKITKTHQTPCEQQITENGTSILNNFNINFLSSKTLFRSLELAVSRDSVTFSLFTHSWMNYMDNGLLNSTTQLLQQKSRKTCQTMQHFLNILLCKFGDPVLTLASDRTGGSGTKCSCAWNHHSDADLVSENNETSCQK